MAKEVRVALAGAPNVGKSTLFNVLVGAHRFVGNWPGKTVDRYEGEVEHHGVRIRFIDLPGTYSLSAQSEEEEIARDFIVNEKPDTVIVVVNAVSMETTMYLALQVLELYDKVVIAVNKIDVAAKMGVHIHVERLSRLLGVPVVPISALKKTGLHELLEATLAVATGSLRTKRLKLSYGILDYYAGQLSGKISKCGALGNAPQEWLALRLLEGDRQIERKAREACPDVLEEALRLRKIVEDETGKSPSLLAASARYSLIAKVLEESVHAERVVTPAFTERLDSYLLRPAIGHLVLFLLVLGSLVLVLGLNTGFPIKQIAEALGMEELASIFEQYTLSGLLSSLFASLGDYLRTLLASQGFPEWAVSLAVDGILAGVGGVLSFLPLIFLVFVVFGFLEDTGIMARIAATYHNLMVRIGLSGKALMPLLLGFGCNVPAIMGTKILSTDREKVLASLLAPLIPCQARLVVLLLLASAIPNPLVSAFLLVFIYAYALLLVAALGYVFSKLFFKAEEEPELLVELPPYHRPSLRVIWWYAWDNTLHFLKKAGVIIFSLSIVVWILMSTGPAGYTQDVGTSYAYLIGTSLAPALALVGLGKWQVALALLSGFIAKESVASTLIIATGANTFSEAFSSLGLNTAQVASLMVFATLYTPCLATVSAFYVQTRNIKYALLLVFYELLIAFASSFTVYSLLSALVH
ncbi:ferrous iron transport protein B [Thermofilum pendens]|uniref:Ferrous iron transport protein B n=1 Tax=Thermofilum pendens (strain DSM 2475 / Hrk 5) TaxID=368408 RepID=A1RYH1_THEPD|nr:ferrous iron transport protein B [Thermofilum pendens]ABL78251.1 ferrous iron transport protein B [Thermofilum pendens Hrk 5]